MSQELSLPDVASDYARFEHGVRLLRDHLLGAVEVDSKIILDGRAYTIIWANRQPANPDEAMYSLTSGMRVTEAGEGASARVVPSGEEQLTVTVDAERFIFNLMEAPDQHAPLRLVPQKARR